VSESQKAHEIYSSWRKQLQLFHLQKSSTESDKATLLSLLPELTKDWVSLDVVTQEIVVIETCFAVDAVVVLCP